MQIINNLKNSKIVENNSYHYNYNANYEYLINDNLDKFPIYSHDVKVSSR